ncbi:MAG: hypothetical protein KatS3mg129_2356 [Leptospiraceae bacterium]|nr:MAG: hypothetical protein KatS3mg129_2356 [Leptospiraceae bacterium]
MNLERIENISFNQNCLIFFDIPSFSNEENLLNFYISQLLEIIEFLKLKNISIHCVPVYVKNEHISQEIEKDYLEQIKNIISEHFSTILIERIDKLKEKKNDLNNIILLHPSLFSFDWNLLLQIHYEHFIINSYKFFSYFKKNSDFNKIDKEKFCISSEIYDSIELLNQFSKATLKPKTGIFGGTRINQTINFLDKNVKYFQYLLFGGGIGITALKANGVNVGNSPYHKEELSNVFQIINKANFEECEVELPVDHIITEKISSKAKTKTSSREIQNPFIAIDIGPKTIQLYEQIIKQSNFILFHAPLGIIELEKGKKGTLELLKTLQKNKKSIIISGNKLCDFALENKISLKMIPDFEFIINYLDQNLDFFNL